MNQNSNNLGKDLNEEDISKEIELNYDTDTEIQTTSKVYTDVQLDSVNNNSGLNSEPDKQDNSNDGVRKNSKNNETISQDDPVDKNYSQNNNTETEHEYIKEKESADIKEKLPVIKLYREDNLYAEASEFLPFDLIHLMIINCGDNRQHKVLMLDERDRTRFIGMKTGKYIKFTTRLQKTRHFGQWKFKINGVTEDGQEYEYYKPFKLVKKISEELYYPKGDDYYVNYFFVPGIFEKVVNLTSDKVAFPYTSDEKEEVDMEAVEEVKLDAFEEYPEVIADFDVTGPPSLIYGIGPKTERMLIKAGYTTALSVARTNAEIMARVLDVSINKTTKWVHRGQIEIFGRILEYSEEIVTKNEYEVNKQFPPSAIPGIGPTIEKILVNFGYTSVMDIANSDVQTLTENIKISEKRANDWINNAKIILEKQKGNAAVDKVEDEKEVDITIDKEKMEKVKGIPVIKIKGIGKTIETKLNIIGIYTVNDLINTEIGELSKKTGISEKRIKAWINGINSLDTKQDTKDEMELTKISGVGKKTAEKLNNAGITSIKKLATTTDIEQLSKISSISINKLLKYINSARDLLNMEHIKYEIKNNDNNNGSFDFSKLKGIGSTYNKKIHSAGIHDLNSLINVNPELLADKLNVNVKKIKMWIQSAKEYV